MTKYIVKDWAGNVMDWGTFSSYDEAWDVIAQKVDDELLSDGIDVNKTYGLESDYKAFEDVLDKIRSDYLGEYGVYEDE
jgi:hypothetical protein